MKFDVTPLTCGRCVRSITEALQAIDPSAQVHVDLAAGTVEASGRFDATAVVSTLAGLGYAAAPASAAAPGAGGSCCGTCHA